MTIPGSGGQAPPRADQQTLAAQPVPVSPGGKVIVARRVIIIGTGGELLVYSPTAGAGNLIESVAGAAFTDQYSNQGLAGNASYSSSTATATTVGSVNFYSGSLAGGWTLQSTVSGDAVGNLQINAAGQLQLISGASGVSINGSTSTGAGDNGGVTSGPSGTVNAFPAAGPNHTHAELHHHPL